MRVKSKRNKASEKNQANLEKTRLEMGGRYLPAERAECCCSQKKNNGHVNQYGNIKSQTLYKEDKCDNKLLRIMLGGKVAEEMGSRRQDVTKGFGCDLAGILMCVGARGWKWWGWWPKGYNDGLGRGRWRGGSGGCNGWGGAGGDGGWWLRRHIDVVQESGEAGTGVDASCGETRAAEEEPVVKN